GGLPVLDVVGRVRLAEAIQAAVGRGDAGSDVHAFRSLSGPALLGLDDAHPVTRARAVDRRRRGVLQDLDGPDFVRIQPVQVRVLHRGAVHDVQRIVVLERAHAPDAHGSARTGRAAVLDGDTGDAAIEALEHAGRRLLLRGLDVYAAHGAGNVGAPLGGIAGHDARVQYRDGLFDHDVDVVPSPVRQRRTMGVTQLT